MSSWRVCLSAWLVLAAVPAFARADAAAGGWRYALRGSTVAVLAAGAPAPESAAVGQVELGCVGQALLEHEAQLYVACGGEGLVLLSIAQPERPVVVARRRLEGEVLGFWVADGTVWVKLRRLEARPVGELTASAPIKPIDAAAPPASPASPDAERQPVVGRAPEPTGAKAGGEAATDRDRSAGDATGQVVELGVGDVVIDLGGEAGLRRDDRIELFVRERVALGLGEAAEQEQVVAVGVVTVVSPRHARVRLGMNERVPLGAGARRSGLPVTQSIVAPPRVGGIYELKATVRPFFTLGAVGFGMLNDFTLGYRFERPIYVGVMLAPFAFATGERRTIVAALVQAVAALDLPLFSIGFGVGLGTPNSQIRNDVAFATMQLVRLGALDGLHVEVQNTLLVDEDEFRHGSTTGTIQIPVSPRWWLLFRGGGGRVGYGFGEAGLRVRVQGHGRRGSVFLNATVGGGALVGDEENWGGSRSARGGPLAGIGVEWRP